MVGGQVQCPAFRAQAKVAVWMVRWVGHQPQVGQVGAGAKSLGGSAVKVKVGRIHIACGQPKHGPQQWQRPGNAARSFQRMAKVLPFVRV